MTKKTRLIWLIASIAVVVSVVAIIIFTGSRSIPEEFNSIPGFVKASKIKSDSFEAIYDVTIKDKSEQVCALVLKIDANGKLILPEKDETFTVVFIDGQGYKLSDPSGIRGSLPGVFITKIEPHKSWSVAKPGTDPMPVAIEPGKINNISLENDTFIDGPRGLPVTIVQNGEELATGRLPMSIKLKQGKAEARIDGAYVSQMQSSGLIHIFLGTQTVSKGANTIHTVAQAVGNSIWFHKGNFIDFDGKTSIVADNTKLYFKDGNNEISANAPDINSSLGAFTSNKKVYWVDSQGFINIADFDGTNKKTSISTNKPITKSGDFLVTGKKAFTMDMKPANSMTGWQWSVDGWFLKLDGEKLVASGKTKWSVKASIPSNASCHKYSDGRIYFELENKVSQIIDLQSGATETAQELALEGQGDINFPDGIFVKDSTQFFDGKSLWNRKGWDIEKFGAFGILCSNPKIGENELINHDTGLKTVFWNDADCTILYLDKMYVVFKINDYVFSVKRIISQY